jgi:Na+/H+-dicarboxylate symporter
MLAQWVELRKGFRLVLQPLISLLLGMFFVNVLEPGGLNLSNVDLTSGSEVVAKTQSISSKFY